MPAQIPIQETQTIDFGKEVVHTDNEILHMYGVYCYNENDYIGVANHHLFDVLTSIRAVLARTKDENNGTLTVTDTVTDDIALMNLGRIAKEEYKGNDLANKIKNVLSELSKNINGVVITTKDAAQKFVPIAVQVMGKGLKNLIGDTNTTKYRPRNDMLGGIVLAADYVYHYATGDIMSRKFLIDRISQKKTIDGVIHASFQPLISSDESTWGSALVSQENYDTETADYEDWKTTGVGLFGLVTTLIDNPILRGVSVTISKKAVSFWQKFLSKTRWEWKHAKWIEIQPLFFIWNPETTDDGAVHGDWAAMLSDGLSDGTNHKYKIWNQLLNDFSTEFKTYFFPKKLTHFVKHKANFELVNFSDIPSLGDVGIGGILFHQVSSWADGGAGTDKFELKYDNDSDAYGHLTLMVRRSSDQNSKVFIIGEVDIETLRILLGLNIDTIDVEGTQSALANTIHQMIPKSMFGFSIIKSEDEPYRLTRYVKDCVAPATVNCSLATNGSNLLPRTWAMDSSDGWHVNMDLSKSSFYINRASDPYKKLDHKVVDINNFDIDLVTEAVCTAIYGNDAGVDSGLVEGGLVPEPVVVSALPTPEIVQQDETETTQDRKEADNQEE